MMSTDTVAMGSEFDLMRDVEMIPHRFLPRLKSSYKPLSCPRKWRSEVTLLLRIAREELTNSHPLVGHPPFKHTSCSLLLSS